jgi:hypothetical protein
VIPEVILSSFRFTAIHAASFRPESGHLRKPHNVFSVALPEDNVFDTPCKRAHLGSVSAGIYSPAVDDGFYVLLKPLSVGTYTLHFHADNPAGTINQDVTYTLKVVQVLRK